MDEIIELARELGRKIAAHPRTQAFATAGRAVTADPQAQKLLNDYQAHVDKIRAREQMRQPIEVADKRGLAELESKVVSHDGLKALMQTQADYVQLMQQVQSAIDEASQGSPES